MLNILDDLHSKLAAELGHEGALVVSIDFFYNPVTKGLEVAGVPLHPGSFVYRSVGFKDIMPYSTAVADAHANTYKRKQQENA